MDDLNAVWKKTLAQIEIKLDSAPHFRTWFKDTRLINIENGEAKIGVKNSYTADWLRSKHNQLVKDRLSSVYGTPLTPLFVYDKEIADKIKHSEEGDEPLLKVRGGVDPDTHNRIQESNLNEKYTFENFIVGPSNRMAHAAALAVADKPGTSYNPLFIYGSTGIGKTHLIQAIGRRILDSNSEKKVLYCTSENFLNDMVGSLRANTMLRFREKYRKLDALIIDDIQLISKAKETQTEFFNTFNVLFQSSKLIVITSDRTPDEIPNIEDRLISRFKGGMVADMTIPDYEERMAILEQKIRDLGLSIPESILKYIAEISKDSIRSLEGALQKVSLCNSMKKDDTLSLAEVERILEQDPQAKRQKVKLPTILKKVAQEFGVTAKDLKGPRRTKDIAFARQVCMYILREEYGYKLQEVSEFLKRNDHTTALHAIDKIESMIQANPTFKEQIENLVADIQRPEEL